MTLGVQAPRSGGGAPLRGGPSRYGPWLCVALALLLVAVVRIRLMHLPLERDEGGFAYTAQLILDGLPPYRHAYDMRLPGTYYAYAAFMAVGGQSAAAIHLGLLLVNALTIAAVFLLARRLFDASAGAAAAAAWALLSLSPSVLGLAAHTMHFVTLPAVVGAYLLVRRPLQDARPATLLLAGLMFGTAFVMKQTSAALGVFGGLWLCWRAWPSPPRRWGDLARRVALYALGCIVPAALVCLAIWWAGSFDRFWFWTVTYAREYGAQTDLRAGLRNLLETLRLMIAPARGLWLLALAGGCVVLVRHRRQEAGVFVAGLLLAACLTLSPGLYFRQHHFIVLLPVVGILAGVAVGALRSRLAQSGLPRVARAGVLAAVVLAAFAAPVWRQSDVFFRMSPSEVSRSTYGLSPFPESLQIAEYLRAHTGNDARIAVLGSEPQIYFYAKRRAATGYLYTYGLMELHPYVFEMQRDMIAEIEAARPEYLVFVNLPTSWLARPDSAMTLLRWYPEYAKRHYELAGVVDLIGADRIEYRWDEQAVGYAPESELHLLVWRRRPEP